jgi:hypothetical protein
LFIEAERAYQCLILLQFTVNLEANIVT